MLAKDQAEVCEQHVLNYALQFDPQGPRENELVQSIADCRWRLGSIPGLESALYARGFREFADMFNDEDENLRTLLIMGKIMTRYRKDFANLVLQEPRPMRRANQEEETLKAMQRKRIAQEEEQLALATHFYLATKKENKQEPSGFCFEFSTEVLERHAEAQIHHQTIAKMKRAS